MKKENIFDTFENAEDEIVDELTNSRPEISDDQLERLLAKSERKYNMKKKEIEMKRNSAEAEDESSVSGVERVKRPVWRTYLAAAASVAIVAGAIFGCVALLNRNGNKSDVSVVGDEKAFATATSVENADATEIVTENASEEHTDGATVSENTEAATENATEGDVTVTEPASETYTEDANETDDEEELKKIAFDLCKAHDDVQPLICGFCNVDKNDSIVFSVDPSLEWSGLDPADTNNVIKNKDYYVRVTDERFGTADEYIRFLKTVYTDNYIEYLKNLFETSDTYSREYEWIGKLDGLAQGDRIDKIYTFVEYNGKLYQSVRMGTLMRATATDDCPVIITNKSDASFTALVPTRNDVVFFDGGYTRTGFPCNEIKIVLDTEAGDWRIDELVDREPGFYKEAYENIGG